MPSVMYLKELRINGFKSFADPTRIHLDRGVTAIVGPNGCGKSNISDAIRWVLGEQSAKSLRGGSMQDVIFQGSDKRKPLGLCEVFLTFADCAKDLGTAYEEVEVGRRVVRDGGSDYYLNGKACRLKDIQRLFLDTGIGQVSYSFLVQGQIDRILSTNPAERRTIFEEAAGISKYKAQRREALNKLALVDANLARVTDVIEEVSRRINSLKRQAAKALRYRKLRHRQTHLDRAFAAHRRDLLRDQLGQSEQEAAQLRSEASVLGDQLQATERELQTMRAHRQELYDALQEVQQKVYDLRAEKEQADNLAELAGLRSEDLSKRVESLRQEIVRLDEQRESASSQTQGGQERHRSEAELVHSADALFQQKSQEVMRAQENLSEAETALGHKRQELLMAEGEASRLRFEVNRFDMELQRTASRLQDLAAALEEIEESSQQESAALLEHEAALAEKREAFEEAEKAVADAANRRQEALAAFRQTQQRIQDLDREQARLHSRVNTMEEMRERFEGYAEGARRLLESGTEDAGNLREIPPIARLIEVAEADRPAIEALLGRALDGLLWTGTEGTPLGLLEKLAVERQGRACIQIPLPVRGGGAGEDVLPDGVGPALERVTVRDERAWPYLEALLQGALVADSLEGFIRFLRNRPEFAFLTVASHDGFLLDYRGVLLGGADAHEAPSQLQREANLREMRETLERRSAELEQLRRSGRLRQEELDTVERESSEAVGRQRELEKEIHLLEARVQAGREAARKADERRESLRVEKERLEQGHQGTREKLEGSKERLAVAQQRHETARTELEEAEQSLETARARCDERREALAEVRLELAEKKQRLEMLSRSMKEAEQRRREVEERRLRCQQEVDELTGQIDTLKEEAASERGRSQEIARTLEQVMARLEERRETLREDEKVVRQREEAIDSDRKRFTEKEQELHRQELQLTRKKAEWDALFDEIRREYDLDLASLDWRLEYWQAGRRQNERLRLDLDEGSEGEVGADDDSVAQEETGDEAGGSSGSTGEMPSVEELAAIGEPAWDAVAEEARELRGRIAAMGAVNHAAIEEYGELKERHDFLKAQSEDLWNSKEQLLQGIDEINTTSQELFAETFGQICKNFQYTFGQLFGGGESDLKLLDSEDPLESGIEIVARPPGTRLRSLALLSGGQKTMTAVALLFAIYMVKPSPFCLLDELDAPLDDANIGRFTAMLAQFTRYSQFTIITHNKRTIAAADSVYGVTMQEKGVSHVVSMRFNRGDPKGGPVPSEAGDLISGEESPAVQSGTGVEQPARS